MHRALSACLVVALLAVHLAPVAWAGGQLEGEGFRLAVPAGFVRLEAEDADHSPVNRLRLDGGLALRGKPDRRVFYAGMPSRPDAVFVAVRLTLADRTGMRSRLDLQRYVLDNICLSQHELQALVAEGEVKLTPTRRGEYDALEMAHDGSRGALGLLGEPATRALIVMGDDFVLVLALMVSDPRAVPVEETWQRVARSLQLDARSAFVQSLLFHAAAGLAVLVLIVFFLRVRAQRRRRAPPAWARVRAVDGFEDTDVGGSVPAPYADRGSPASGPARPEAASAGAALPPPVLAREPVPPPPVAVVQAGGDLGARYAPETPAAVPGAPATEPEPARAGLRRTRPTGGRYSA